MGENRTLLAASDLKEIAAVLDLLDDTMDNTSLRVKVALLEFRGEVREPYQYRHFVTAVWDPEMDKHFVQVRTPVDTLLDVAESLTEEADNASISGLPNRVKESAEYVTKEDNCWCNGDCWGDCIEDEAAQPAVNCGTPCAGAGVRTSGGVAQR